MTRIKVVICGGHAAPAIALIEELQKSQKYDIFYIGRKMALEGDKALSLEYSEIKKLGIPFYNYSPARMQRNITFHTVPSLLKLPLGLVQGYKILRQTNPDIIVSFGSYVALPICLTGKILGIPIITHEQTHTLGLSNRIISRFAVKTCLSWQNTKSVPGGLKTIVTGNPLRSGIVNMVPSEITDFGNKKFRLIYITGGSLGSRSINIIVKNLIPGLVNKYRILHQCGSANNSEDFRTLTGIRNKLPPYLKNNYSVLEHIDQKLIGTVLNSSSLVIGRSGANTVNELLTVKVPAILIPLPWSADGEQTENAEEFVATGRGIMIKQSELTPELLENSIRKILKNSTGNSERHGSPFTGSAAAENLEEEILKSLKII